ncbi:MAG: hypothetical protein HQK53_02210 [Oligoflexia bacterium]|nr:hypothetical protein [Oligoflexia bacterium]
MIFFLLINFFQLVGSFELEALEVSNAVETSAKSPSIIPRVSPRFDFQLEKFSILFTQRDLRAVRKSLSQLGGRSGENTDLYAQISTTNKNLVISKLKIFDTNDSRSFRYYYVLLLQSYLDQILDFYIVFPSFMDHQFVYYNLQKKFAKVDKFARSGSSSFYIWNNVGGIKITYSATCTVSCFPLFLEGEFLDAREQVKSKLSQNPNNSNNKISVTGDEDVYSTLLEMMVKAEGGN